MARALEIRLRLSHQRTLESGDGELGALAPIYGTLVTAIIAMAMQFQSVC